MIKHTLCLVRMVFLANASHQIGAGHVMRLSAIAEEAISRGIECFFVGTIDGVEWLEDYVYGIGFSKILNSQSLWDVVGTQNILVIDSYQFSIDDPSLNPDNWGYVVSIADPETPAYIADLVVYPGISTVQSNQKRPNFLSGPKFIPFRKCISQSRELRSTANPRLLIFGGGTDQFGMAPQVARLIRQKYSFKEANFMYHASEEIEALDSRFKVHPFGSSLDSIIDRSDIVITSASTSSFEVLVRGLPTGIIRLIRNQDDNFRALGQAKLVSIIGSRSDHGSWSFSERELEKLILDAKYRNDISHLNLEKFDLLGSSRILDKIFLKYEGIV
jgi:spore coat polysaccharide biosynthesis predicted glycosyltransferase SpsG